MPGGKQAFRLILEVENKVKEALKRLIEAQDRLLEASDKLEAKYRSTRDPKWMRLSHKAIHKHYALYRYFPRLLKALLGPEWEVLPLEPVEYRTLKSIFGEEELDVMFVRSPDRHVFIVLASWDDFGGLKYQVVGVYMKMA